MLSDHDDRLDGESPSTVIEEIFQGRAEQIDDEDVVETLLPEVINIRNAGWERPRVSDESAEE